MTRQNRASSAAETSMARMAKLEEKLAHLQEIVNSQNDNIEKLEDTNCRYYELLR